MPEIPVKLKLESVAVHFSVDEGVGEGGERMALLHFRWPCVSGVIPMTEDGFDKLVMAARAVFAREVRPLTIARTPGDIEAEASAARSNGEQP